MDSAVRAAVTPSESASAPPTFAQVYDDCSRFVFRVVVRLGVRQADVEDIVQQVFIVVHRRLAEFEGRSTLRTWIYGIALGITRNHRRTAARKRLDGARQADVLEAEEVPDDAQRGPDARLERAQAGALLLRLLEELEEDEREVFVLAELEEMTAPEIAEVLGLKVNTVYSRLRRSREAFEEAVRRERARESRRGR